jgi:PilZ domain-containing protein
MRKEEKRNARRIHLANPVEGNLSHFPIAVLDLSTSGARIQHDSPLGFHPGKRYTLEFSCEGDKFELRCQLVRSRMEQNHGEKKQLVYTSGLRFMDLDEESIERLWGLIALLAIDFLEQEAFQEDIPYEFEILQS